MRTRIEHAAGDVAGGIALTVPGPGNSSAVSLKRCAGWRYQGHEGQGAHMLPATVEYFGHAQYRPDGLNHRCKACGRAYDHYKRRVWNEERARRKAANEAKVAP
jgi:hypothetical protein